MFYNLKKYIIVSVFFICISINAQLKNPKNLPYNWKTDTTKHTTQLSNLTVTTAKDMLPTLNLPEFITQDDSDYHFYDHEPVIVISENWETKAYPLSLLTMYELTNDLIGGEQIMVSYCPMCNSAMCYNRKLFKDSVEHLLNFGISGLLMHNDMIMYDRETETWWEQIMGEAMVGELAGSSLEMMSALIISAEDYFDRYPDGLILSPVGLELIEDGEMHRPFYHLDHDKSNVDSKYFVSEKFDDRLPPLERVLDIHVFDHDKIYPFSAIAKKQVINEVFYDTELVIFYHDKTVSVLDEDDLSKSKRVGSATAFEADLDGVNYTFKKHGEYFMDNETSSIWDITGFCREGKLKGKQLWIIPHSNHFAFAYLAFYPKSEIYGQD